MMLLELRLPHISKGVTGARVARWLSEPGERIARGDDLVVVEAEQRTKLDVSRNAKLLSKLWRKSVPTSTGTLSARVPMRLTATEPAILRRLLVEPGSYCRAGEPLALLTTRADELVDGEAALALRVVVNLDVEGWI